MEWLLLPPLALFGVMAGGWLPKINKIASPLIGVCLLWLVGVQGWWLLAGLLAGWLAEKPGVGHPIGTILDGYESGDKKLEKWQPEFTRHRPRVALIIRGLISGIVYLPLALIEPHVFMVIPAYAIAWPLTVWPIKNGWKWSEAGRQVVCGSLLILVT